MRWDEGLALPTSCTKQIMEGVVVALRLQAGSTFTPPAPIF